MNNDELLLMKLSSDQFREPVDIEKINEDDSRLFFGYVKELEPSEPTLRHRGIEFHNSNRFFMIYAGKNFWKDSWSIIILCETINDSNEYTLNAIATMRDYADAKEAYNDFLKWQEGGLRVIDTTGMQSSSFTYIVDCNGNDI